ncbi:membrane-bound transcription factor peptidase [Cavenderia fasciculata]|uniref:Membrane-bound transcription factor peptidase n=1 Tax=Cavenderia fasciculata TaxID=261658 RepID=F4PYN0_CACFS|nr:membrane-bound transcription factor peptidase [Cavenderia fasciculata]EGG19296.1 membrane-bound transcription factor peptidase [Cavenderia fasciculata]|eukprot:XP_004357567.1 membrane-bound transcription factor peptidase [Cavenderia fasciculata]
MRIRRLILMVLVPLLIAIYINNGNNNRIISLLFNNNQQQQLQQQLLNNINNNNNLVINNYELLTNNNNNNDNIFLTPPYTNNNNITNIYNNNNDYSCTKQQPSSSSSSSLTIQKDFIVMFNKYYKQDEHYNLIESILKKSHTTTTTTTTTTNKKDSNNNQNYKWKIVKRNNPASHLPSDFALVSVTIQRQQRYIEKDICSIEKGIYNQECDALFKGAIGDLVRHGGDLVKNVYPDRKIFGMEALAEKVNFNDDDSHLHFEPPTSIVSRVPFGRIHDDIPEVQKEEDRDAKMSSNSKRQLFAPDTTRASSVTMLDVESMWMNGYTGNKTVVAIFDTGLTRKSDYPFNKVVMETDWTGKKSTNDYLGHGTFVAGIIASNLEGCPGMAQDSELYIYKVFSDEKESFTSWFLDAFNHAIQTKVDVLNLSIGGKDYMDRPFVEKIREVTANRITVVSAMGNDGPLYGTLSNPADQSDVIGVGSINFNGAISDFSSRGMTTWELPEGDLWKLNLWIKGRGALNVLGAYKRLKQNIQDLKESNRTGKLLLHPNRINYEECPYFWPYCTQPLYYSAIPTIFNVTVLNGMDVYGKIQSVTWEPAVNGHLLDMGFSYEEEVYPFSGHVGIHVSVKKDAEFFGGMVSGDIKITVLDAIGGSGQTVALPVNIRVIPTPPRQKRILWDQFHSLKYPLGYFPVDEIDMMPKVKTFDWDGDHPHTNFKQLYEVLRKNGYFVEVLGSPLTCFDPLLYGSLLIIDSEEEFHPTEIKKIEEDVRANGLNLIVIGDWYNVDVLQKIQFHDKKSNRHWVPVTGGANIPAVNDLLSSFGIIMGDSVYDGDFSLGSRSSYYSSGSSIVGFPQGGIVVQATLTDQTRQILNGRTSQPTVPILGFYQTKEFNISFDDISSGSNNNNNGMYSADKSKNNNQIKYINNENSDSLDPTTTSTAIDSNGSPSSSISSSQQSAGNNILSSDSPTSIQSGQVVVFGDSSCFDESTHCFESNDCNGTPKKNCFWMMENILDVLQGKNVFEVFPEAKQLALPLTPLNEQTNRYEIPLRPSNNGDIEKYSRVTAHNALQSSAFQQCYNQLYSQEKYRWHNLYKYENVSWSQRSQILPPLAQPPSNPSLSVNDNNSFYSYYFIPYIFVIIALLLLFIHFTRKKPTSSTSSTNSPISTGSNSNGNNSNGNNNNNSSSISITTSPTLQRLLNTNGGKSDVDV